MSDKCCNWSITINNPTDDDNRQWACLKDLPWVKEVVGQLEKGQEGTLHIQGMVKTQSVRFAQIKKALPRAHIEPARNALALKQYVTKEETRVAPIAQVKVATQSDVQNRIIDVLMKHGHKHYNWNGCYFIDFINSHIPQLREDWEVWTDTAVRELIKEGYYGVEFVMANPQVRTAFRKYFVEIMYRTYNARQTHSTQENQPQTSIQPPSNETKEWSCTSVYESQPTASHNEDVQA